MSPVIIAAGSASGVAIIICIILLALIVVALLYLKRRKNRSTFHFTSNVAYTGHCTKDGDINYYSASQPAPQSRSVTYQNEMKGDSLATDHIAASKSSYCTGISSMLDYG